MKFKREAEVILTMNRQANKNDLMPLLKRVLGIMLREYKAQFCLGRNFVRKFLPKLL